MIHPTRLIRRISSIFPRSRHDRLKRKNRSASLYEGWVIANHILVSFHVAFISSVLTLPPESILKADVLKFIFLSPETLISALFLYISFHTGIALHEIGHFLKAARLDALNQSILPSVKKHLSRPAPARLAYLIGVFIKAPYGKAEGIKREGLNYYPDSPYNLAVAAAGPETSRNVAVIALVPAVSLLTVGLISSQLVAIYIGRLFLGIGIVTLLDFLLADPGKYREFREREKRAVKKAETVTATAAWYEQAPEIKRRMLGGRIQEVTHPNLGPVTAPWQFRNCGMGGRHTEKEYPESNISMQEAMFLILGAHDYQEAQEMTVRLQTRLKEIIEKAEGGRVMGIGLEGGLAPYLEKGTYPLPEVRLWSMMKEAIAECGYRPGIDVAIALDPAMSELEIAYREEFNMPDAIGMYLFWRDKAKVVLDRDGVLDIYLKAIREFDIPIVSIEDGFSENDDEGWKKLLDALGDRIFVIGDDLVTTNDKTIETAANGGLINTALIKANQIGTLYETLIAMLVALGKGLELVISHRSKSPNDDMEAQIAVAVNSLGLKAGGGANTERLIKYQAVAEILGKAPDAGASQALFEDQKAVIKQFYSYEEPTNAGIPTVGTTAQFFLPDSGLYVRFRGATPLGTSAGAGEAIHLVDSSIEIAEHREVIQKHKDFFHETEKGVYSFSKHVSESQIRATDDDSLLALFLRAQRYNGKGCLNAVDNVLEIVAHAFEGRDAAAMTLRDIDRMLLDLELRVAVRRGKLQTDAAADECILVAQRKQNIGMNAMLSASLALARGIAHVRGKELYELLREEILTIINRLAREYGVEISGSRFTDYVAALRSITTLVEKEGSPLHIVLRRLTGIYAIDAETTAPPPPPVAPETITVPEEAVTTLKTLMPLLDPEFIGNKHHGLRHAEALLHHATILAEKCDLKDEIDWKILSAGICLHDYGSNKKWHEADGASTVGELLSTIENFTAEEIRRIEESILLHEDRTQEGSGSRKSAGPEAQILYDINQIDFMGVRGIYRYVSLFSERGASLEAMGEDARIRYDSLTFPESRALVDADFKYTEMFFDKFLKESSFEDDLQGARGVVEFLRLNAGVPVVELAEKALNTYEQEDNSPETQFAVDFFSALKATWLSTPSLLPIERVPRPKIETPEPTEPTEEKPVPSEIPQYIAGLNQQIHRAFAFESRETAWRDAIRSYLDVKTSLAKTTAKFGIVNNRIFKHNDRLFVPYLLDRTLDVYGIHGDKSKLLATRNIPLGSIITDKSIMELAGFEAEPLDLERELFSFGLDQAETVQIVRLGDLGSLLKRVNESTNRNEALYLLRFLVASLCGLSFKAFLTAKNLQPEVRTLIDQVVDFLNSPLRRRIPLITRLVVRNISGLVAKPSLIDRLWNDTIDLAEIHIPGSSIVNELRRSTHHALGKRTLLLARGYLDYIRDGSMENLSLLGYPSPSRADEEARKRKPPRKIVERVVEDLEKLLGTSEIFTRIQDWKDDYRAALLRCDFGRSIYDEINEISAKGIRGANKWIYSHHLRILKKKGEDFRYPEDLISHFVEGVNTLLKMRPDEPGFDADSVESTLRSDVGVFIHGIQEVFEEQIFASLDAAVECYRNNEFLESFGKIRDLRRNLWEQLDRDGFTEQRYYLYQLDCLMEEMAYLSLSHISTMYEEHGVDIHRCLEIIQTCIKNLGFDGKYSRVLVDLGGMLTYSKRTYAEVTNLLESIQRNYHRIIQRVTGPYEMMHDRLGYSEEELRTVLANMKRYMHDLNSMVHFCDLARSYILENITDLDTFLFPDHDREETSHEALEIAHLSHGEWVREWVKSTEVVPNLRERFGGKGAGLIYISHRDIPTRDAFILPTSIAKLGLYESDPDWLNQTIREHLSILEDDIASRDGIARRYGDPENPLLVAVRGGSVFSMPGILSTIVFVGINDQTVKSLAKDDPWHAYDSYRRFLASYAYSVWGVDVESFDLVEETKRRYGVKFKKDLPWQGMQEVMKTSKAILRRKGYGDELDAILEDPYLQLIEAVKSVFASWNKETPQRYRDIKGICHTWQTAVTVQEMASGNRTNSEVCIGMDETGASLTGVIPHTQLTDRGVRTFVGEIKFSASGDDLVGGVTKSSSLLKIGELNPLMPMLYRRLRHTVAKIRRFQGTDQEIEFTVERGVLSILQSRSAEISIDQEARTFVEPGEAVTRGIGIRGGGFRGVVAFDEDDWRELSAIDFETRDDVDGVIMVIENPTPDDIPLLLQANALLTVKGGSSSHAAVAIHGIQKKRYCAVMSAVGLRVNTKMRQATFMDDKREIRYRVKKGDIISIHGTTGEVYVGSRRLQESNGMEPHG